MKDRIAAEIEQGRKLSRIGAERAWNWASPAGQERWERRVSLLLCASKKSPRVLELGCGTGLLTRELVGHHPLIVGFDISRDLLQHAMAKLADSDVSFVLGDAMNVPFQSESFDAVVGSSILHHVEINVALHEIIKILKPGGVFAFAEPNMLNPQIAIQKNIPIIKRLAGDTPDETAYFKWAAKKALLNAGFVKIGVIPFDFLHPSIPGFLLPLARPIAMMLERLPLVKEIAGSLLITGRKPG